MTPNALKQLKTKLKTRDRYVAESFKEEPMNIYKKNMGILFFGLTAMVALTNEASAFEVDPLDYLAAPEGTNLAIFYTGYINNLGGNNGLKLNANVDIARFVFFRKFLGYTIDPQVIIPFGYQNLSISGAQNIDTAGVADPIVAATVWFYEGKKTQFGVTPLVSLPIGSYSNDGALSFGSNRFAGTLQAALIHSPIPKLWLEGVADITLYTDNKKFGPTSATLSQKPSYQFQALASYGVTEEITLGTNFSWQRFGETEINNIAQGDEADVTKLSLYGQFKIAPTIQVQAKYTRELKSEAAIGKTQLFQLRLVKVF